MSHSQIGKKRPTSYWNNQKIRTTKNKQRKREKHITLHPNDQEAKYRHAKNLYKRWVKAA